MPSQETTNAVTEQRIEALEKLVQELSADRDRALRWGVMALGAAVLGLGTWIFNFITGHIK